jgi:hypothetical protein
VLNNNSFQVTQLIISTSEERLSMSIVRFNKTYKVCATCTFWQGPRQSESGCFVFNNRDTDICCGASFKDWKMGATSTCLNWQLPAENGLGLENFENTLTPSLSKK